MLSVMSYYLFPWGSVREAEFQKISRSLPGEDKGMGKGQEQGGLQQRAQQVQGGGAFRKLTKSFGLGA